MIKAQYDMKGDSAYIYFADIGPGEVSFTYPCNPKEVKGMINLDFSKDGKLIGVEVIGATKKLPREILESAERIDKNNS